MCHAGLAACFGALFDPSGISGKLKFSIVSHGRPESPSGGICGLCEAVVEIIKDIDCESTRAFNFDLVISTRWTSDVFGFYSTVADQSIYCCGYLILLTG
ncbi:hypothetical protein P8452_61785 [Trifolium repens]|nr:hypothetical protein P8452_61785 [Trifolium repens]